MWLRRHAGQGGGRSLLHDFIKARLSVAVLVGSEVFETGSGWAGFARNHTGGAISEPVL